MSFDKLVLNLDDIKDTINDIKSEYSDNSKDTYHYSDEVSDNDINQTVFKDYSQSMRSKYSALKDPKHNMIKIVFSSDDATDELAKKSDPNYQSEDSLVPYISDYNQDTHEVTMLVPIAHSQENECITESYNEGESTVLEIDLDTNIIIDDEGFWDYSSVEWSKPSDGTTFWRSSDDKYHLHESSVDVIDKVSDLLDKELIYYSDGATYHVTGTIYLVYDVSEVDSDDDFPEYDEESSYIDNISITKVIDESLSEEDQSSLESYAREILQYSSDIVDEVEDTQYVYTVLMRLQKVIESAINFIKISDINNESVMTPTPIPYKGYQCDKDGKLIKDDDDTPGAVLKLKEDNSTTYNECTQPSSIGSHKVNSIDLIETKGLELSVPEVVNDPTSGDKLVIEINGKSYTYEPTDLPASVVADTVRRMQKYSQGKALAYLKKHMDLSKTESVEDDAVSFKDTHVCNGCGNPLSKCTCMIDDIEEE